MHHFPTVSFKRRLAALLYEALLVGAVSMGGALAAGLAAMLTNPVSALLSSLAITLIMLADAVITGNA